jgi:hypothetical protein
LSFWLARAGSIAFAGPDAEVPSAPDGGPGMHVTVDYDFSYRHSVIERETIDGSATPGVDPTALRKEFVYSSQRHTLMPRVEAGVRDVWIYGALPYVITDSRQLEFDQGGSPCIFTGAQPSCVNRANSSTIADGILPMTGYDARNPTVGFTDPTQALIFRGPDRSGLDQLWLGVGWAPMTQRSDDTKPTWKIGAELRIAVGKVAKLDRLAPNSETGVGEGADEVRLWTSFDRRRGWAEPYVELWWQAPIAYTKDSPYQDPGFGARRTDKQQLAGMHFGFEAIAVDNPNEHERFSIDLSGLVQAHFEGRQYSELWEMFAYAGDPAGGGPLVLDSDPVTPGVQAMAHPGVTNVENYMELGGRIDARAEIGRVHLSAFGAFTGETQHIISFTDAGVDLPTCKMGQSPPGCEVDNNDLVNPGTVEVNPLHVPLIDLVGHRYRSVGAMNFHIGAELKILF